MWLSKSSILLALLGPLVCAPVALLAATGYPVTTQSLQELGFYPNHNAPATTESLNDARLSAEISGVLVEIPVLVGDLVPAGHRVAQLDCEEHQFAAEQARALLRAARAERDFSRFQLERAQQLSATQSLSAEILNEREAQAHKAAAELTRLSAAVRAEEWRVEKCEIRAPFDAVVIERLASVGELVGPGSTVLRLLDLEHLEVKGDIQEQDLAGLMAASSIRFESGGESYPVAIRTVVPVVDVRLRSQEVRFRFLDRTALPGTVGRVRWSSPRLHIPADLLVRRGNNLGLFLERDGVARFHALEVALEGQPAPIDLPMNTQVIVEGRLSLRDGVPVLVMER